MSITKQANHLANFIGQVFDRRENWCIRDAAVSAQGWSCLITHNLTDHEWSVMGDDESILLRATEGTESVGVSMANGMEGALWALHACQGVASPRMWGWLKIVEEEQDFTEVEEEAPQEEPRKRRIFVER